MYFDGGKISFDANLVIYKKDIRNSKSSVAVARFLPGRAKNLSAPLLTLHSTTTYNLNIFNRTVLLNGLGQTTDGRGFVQDSSICRMTTRKYPSVKIAIRAEFQDLLTFWRVFVTSHRTLFIRDKMGQGLPVSISNTLVRNTVLHQLICYDFWLQRRTTV